MLLSKACEISYQPIINLNPNPRGELCGDIGKFVELGTLGGDREGVKVRDELLSKGFLPR